MAPYENLRTIQDTWVQIEPFDEAAVTPDPLTWLAGWARPGMFLLLHADDGICWGKGVKQAFTFSDATVNARYSKHPVLIQTARLFDATEEVFLWRIDGDGIGVGVSAIGAGGAHGFDSVGVQ